MERVLNAVTLWDILSQGYITGVDGVRKVLVTYDGNSVHTLWSEETPGLFCKRVVQVGTWPPTTKAVEMMLEYTRPH